MTARASGALPAASDAELDGLQLDRGFRNIMIEGLNRLEHGRPGVRTATEHLERLLTILGRP